MPKQTRPVATTLKPETGELIERIQAHSDLGPSIPQVVHAAVKRYAKELGVEA